MPLISVLMPVFNREKLIGDAVRSIQNQTLHDWELIVLDDASTDKTLDACRALEAEDRRIRVLVNERNLGCGKSRNRLLACAAGEYIAIHDSDDVSIPLRFAREVEILESKPNIALVSGIATWIDIEDGHVLLNYPPYLDRGQQYPQERSDLVRLLYLDCEVAVTTCMFRRSLLERIAEPFGKYRYVDDWYFFLQVAHQFRMWGIPEVLAKMKRGTHHAHLWADNLRGLKEAQRMKRDIYEYYKDDPDSPINYFLYRRSVARLLKAQGRYLSGWKKYASLLRALVWDPSYVLDFSGRAFRKGKGLVRKRLVNEVISGN